jgi:NitT/TauT family transport system substrate-binding protein
MHMMQDRRRFLATLSSAGAAGLIGAPASFAQEAPPETTTIRLAKNSSLCIAPQYVAEDLLRAEGADLEQIHSTTLVCEQRACRSAACTPL